MVTVEEEERMEEWQDHLTGLQVPSAKEVQR